MITKGQVVFVRHALPVVDATMSSRLWPLTEQGRLATRQLAARLKLEPNQIVVSSDEIKARETADLLSDRVTVDPRLAEVQRPWVADDYRQLAETWLGGAPVQGWESMPSAIERMGMAVNEAIGKGEGSAYLVTHGLIMSAYIGSVAEIDPGALWSELGFPDVRALDFHGRSVHN